MFVPNGLSMVKTIFKNKKNGINIFDKKQNNKVR